MWRLTGPTLFLMTGMYYRNVIKLANLTQSSISKCLFWGIKESTQTEQAPCQKLGKIIPKRDILGFKCNVSVIGDRKHIHTVNH